MKKILRWRIGKTYNASDGEEGRAARIPTRSADANDGNRNGKLELVARSPATSSLHEIYLFFNALYDYLLYLSFFLHDHIYFCLNFYVCFLVQITRGSI
jgi:hypothetical protein